MKDLAEPVIVRGSTREELDRELARFSDELRVEFAKYHQREFRDHHLASWFIHWLMADELRSADLDPKPSPAAASSARR